MKTESTTVEAYLEQLPDERKSALTKLRNVLSDNLPAGFLETLSYGMPSYVVPHSLYAPGYHCDPKRPLPFISMASQKNFIALYHMGIYMHPHLMDWFVSEYPKYAQTKVDIGKSCIRLKKMDDIPYQLIGELAAKLSVPEWIALYESNLKK